MRDSAPIGRVSGPPASSGQERGADGVGARLGQVEAHDGAKERVGDLGQDSGAVAGVGLTALGAAVLEVAQGGQGLVHDRPAAAARHVDDEGNTAGVMLRRPS